MKMVKSLLLGSAASVVAAAGGQAADLPVKAKPVEYVKICSLYGDGFYYIPGTDFCVRFAGNAQLDAGFNTRGNGQSHYFGAFGAQDRITQSYATRARGDIDVDVRTQSEYGTVRAFTRTRIDITDLGTSQPALPRSFIQWAGWTFGRVKSLSDIPGQLGDDGLKQLHQTQNHSDSGANGNTEISYTWELGNGMTLNVGGAERRAKAVANLSNNAWTAGADPTSSQHGMQSPDPFVSFQVNQAWGRVGASVTAKNIKATYYTGFPPAPSACANGIPGIAAAQPGSTLCGHPGDEWGFAVNAGIIVNAPWIAPGDLIGGFIQYGQGGGAQATGNNLTSPGLFAGGNNLALGALTDAVYVNGSGLELTTAWSTGGGIMHWWTPTFSTAVIGSFTQVTYNDTVINGRWFCGGGGGVTQNVVVSAATVCDPSFNFWTVSSHTDWYPVRGLRLGIEVMYTAIDSAFEGQTISLSKAQGARPTGTYTAKNEGILSVYFRAQRRWPAGGD